MSSKTTFFLLGIFLSTQGLSAQDLEIKAYVSSRKIPVDQQFELNVELSGRDAKEAPQPALPDIESFADFRGTSSSQSIQIVNGQMSVTVTYTHRFIATEIGKFEIPPVRIEYGGKNFTTSPIPIQIVKGQGSTDTADDLAQLLFLKAVVNKNRVYQNEPVIVSYKIYTAVTISSYGISQLPNTVGFWSEEFPTPNRPPLHTEVVNGRRYQVAGIKKVALFPQGPGPKTLDPMVIECKVQIRNRRRRRDIFDSFFDDPFFSLNRTTTKAIRSNPVKIDVLPLPAENKPRDFSGSVGNFSLSASVDKERVKTNEAVTLTVTISGMGNIKILTQPDVEFPSDFEVYDPKISENINRNEGEISGSKTFEYVLIPRFPGTQTIRPISFSYFDLSSKSYKTLSSDPINISVAKGKDQPVNVPLATSKEDVKFIGQDIRFIQTRLPEFQEIGTVFYKEVPFFAILILPLLVLAGAYGYSRHLEKMSSNVAYARSRKANQMALKRLRNANKAMQRGNLREFYGEVSKALMGFIGDKLNVSAAGLITDEVDSVLRSRGIRDETVANYLNCLRTCDFKRFAPSDADNGEMKDFFEKARKAIIDLDKEI